MLLGQEFPVRAILILDMSFTLKMYRERQLEQALESRKLGGYFGRVISVHPLAGLFSVGNDRYGDPVVTELDDTHVFVEGKIGASSLLRMLPPFNFIWAQAKLIRLLFRIGRDARVDVVRVGDPYYLGLMGWLLARLLHVPLAIRVCFNYDQLYEVTGKPVLPRLFGFRVIEKIVERFVFPRCALIAGANQNNLDYAIAHGAAASNGVVFRYGNLIHPMHFTEPSTRGGGDLLTKELGVEGDFLVTVSRLEKMKQPEENLRVLRRLLDLGHEVTFIFIGDGSMRAQLEKMTNELGLGGRVIFAGSRPQGWIAKVLPRARLALSPHMGRALTEACLAGLPIVAYDYDWQREIIHDGETGELVPVGDWEQMASKASQLLSDPARALHVGRSARKVAMEMMDPQALESIEVAAYEALFHRRGEGLCQEFRFKT